jgi:ribosome-associated protein
MIVKARSPKIGEASIPEEELSFSFVRSSGPGGQNVNKTNSKAVLTWNVEESTSITASVKMRFKEAFANRVSDNGQIVIMSDETRDRAQNQQRCVDKLLDMLNSVWTPPKIRKPTKPTRSSQRKRMVAKKQRTEIKGSRGKVREW